MLNWTVRNRTVWSFNYEYLQNLFTSHIYLIYMYKQDLTLNNLQWLLCHQPKPNQIIWPIFLLRVVMAAKRWLHFSDLQNWISRLDHRNWISKTGSPNYISKLDLKNLITKLDIQNWISKTRSPKLDLQNWITKTGSPKLDHQNWITNTRSPKLDLQN